jgi:hypothetical protein
VVSSAEIAHKLRHRKGHHKHKLHSTTEKPQIENINEIETSQESGIPSNIWAILAANSLTNLKDKNDEIKTVPMPIDLDFDAASHETVNCPGCAQVKNLENVSEDDLDELRIEYVKNEILSKLRLSERPPKKEKLLDDLPEPVQEGHTAEEHHEIKNILNTEDYYAKTTQKIVFLTQGEF